MKKSALWRIWLYAGGALLFASCQKDLSKNQNTLNGNLSPSSSLSKSDQNLKINTFKGPEVQMGKGMARSWITISHTGVPQELGIELTAGALQGLPQNSEDPAHNSFILSLHQKAKEVTPFDHIFIDWNPQGHPPGPYMVPHFDFHFYMMSLADQMAIPDYSVAPALFDNLPPVDYRPANYFPIPEGVAQMGKHWADVTSPELNGSPFTKTFIYGSYNGKFTFYEPMVAMSFLQNPDSAPTPIPQPKLFSPDHTYYPTTYYVVKDPSTGKVNIVLSGFTWR